MLSRMFALLTALLIICGTMAVPCSAETGTSRQYTSAQQSQLAQSIASQVKQSWINSYAENRNLDPATVKWDDLPADLRARYDKVFSSSAN